MIRLLYIEDAVSDHPRARSIRARFPDAAEVPCARWGEVFNRKSQSFRLQKQSPSLLLASKHDGFVLPTPEGYGIGGARNFYFSHMLNCPYDCRYCFLQGMYRSAHWVVFVNFEDFERAIAATVEEAAGEECWFFSGYDCDSLALESVTGFAAHFLPLFERTAHAWLELRTKSVQVDALLEREPVERCVVAWSLSPSAVAREVEHGAPSVERRLRAAERLAERGWQLGLRFDPLLLLPDYGVQFEGLLEEVFSRLPAEALHSVSLGLFRLPRPYHRALVRLYPEEPLLAAPFEEASGLVGYRRDLAEALYADCRERLLRFVPEERFFPCLS